MGSALIEAAGQAGVRLTLIDTCYLHAGLGGEPLSGVQRRFGDGDAAAWAERAGALHDGPTVRVAAGIHSVRAVDPAAMTAVAAWAQDRLAPLHLHLSEQRAENQACLAASGRTPAALAEAAGVLGPRATAVHATHLTGDDIARLGASRTAVCLCPTTERDLADGVGPAAALAGAGSPLCLGSDSHAVVDLFEEARAVELDERLVTERRGHHRPADLLQAATAAGMDALGWEAGRLEPGRLADLVTVGLHSPRLAGTRPAEAVDQLVFAATAADVRQVVVGGRQVVEDGRHLLVGDVAAALAKAIAALWP
jgi:formiminoglutamate deiminase